MHLDLNNPRSIVAWWQVYPERHGPQLSALARLQPQFAASIREARRLIDDDPLLAERHAAARRQQALVRAWVPSAEDRELDQLADPLLDAALDADPDADPDSNLGADPPD
ncbi:MAG TPA: hypothetical protein VK195_06275, partial [Burkholderiaceae bacterium]|nr:hypothetical protein [Burkholderiaceae bacterium]